MHKRYKLHPSGGGRTSLEVEDLRADADDDAPCVVVDMMWSTDKKTDSTGAVVLTLDEVRELHGVLEEILAWGPSGDPA